MKSKVVFIVLLITLSFGSFAQSWTQAQLNKANTAKDISYLSEDEKETILYINLCRLYPKDFLEIEVANFQLSKAYGALLVKQFNEYKTSLQKELLHTKECDALVFDSILYLDAKCYAAEISKAKRINHARIDCKESNYAECVSMGFKSGRDIAIHLLIDTNVPSLGHRKTLLDTSLKKIGVSTNVHFEFRYCAVIELI